VKPEKAVRGRKVLTPLFLTLKVDGGEWSASRPGRFNTEGETPIPVEKAVGWASGAICAF
jgi:hypothetical protein